MAKSIISEGKTSKEAIDKGLRELKCKLDDVNVKVLEDEDKKAFFSILSPRVVKVELTMKEDREVRTNVAPNIEHKVASEEDVRLCEDNIKIFLNEFTKAYGNVEFSIEKNDDNLFVVISGEQSSKLIGYRGDTINSLQNILSAIGNKNTTTRVRVSLDICEYRMKREKSLNELAKKIEKTVIRTGKKVVLEPMSAYERKIIHSALQGSTKVTTYSVGEEPFRKIVIDRK